MKLLLLSLLASAAMALVPVAAQADYYGTCKGVMHSVQTKDKKNFYVGGDYKNHHLHVGSDFISITSNQNNGKLVPLSGHFNCQTAALLVRDIDQAGFKDAGSVKTCLQAACSDFCTGRGDKNKGTFNPCAGKTK